MGYNKYVFRKSLESNQVIGQDYYIEDVLEPFVSWDTLLELYYVNPYHRRALQTKALLLSQIEETDLEQFLPVGVSPKEFMYSFCLNLEIFGNGFVEEASAGARRMLYLLPTREARIDKDRGIVQRTVSGQDLHLEGYHLAYYSPSSRFYGEPDYLSVLAQILTEQKVHEYNQAFFDNGATPDLAIIFEGAEPSDEQLDAFRDFFATNYKGTLNAHKTLVLSAPGNPGDSDNPKVSIEPLNQIKDMSFEKLKKMQREEIIAAHNIPPRMVGLINAGQLGGGSELISQLHAFNELEIKPKLLRIEEFFDRIGVKLVLKPIDVTNFKDDADVITGLVQLGIVSVQEARDILGWQKNLDEG